MEETTGAPSSFAVYRPRRLRASSRDGGDGVNRPPSTLTMLLSRHTRRREFIGLLASVAFARPQVARAQQTGIPVVGYLGQGSAESDDVRLAGLRRGLAEAGHVEGRNVS